MVGKDELHEDLLVTLKLLSVQLLVHDGSSLSLDLGGVLVSDSSNGEGRFLLGVLSSLVVLLLGVLGLSESSELLSRAHLVVRTVIVPESVKHFAFADLEGELHIHGGESFSNNLCKKLFLEAELTDAEVSSLVLVSSGVEDSNLREGNE